MNEEEWFKSTAWCLALAHPRNDPAGGLGRGFQTVMGLGRCCCLQDSGRLLRRTVTSTASNTETPGAGSCVMRLNRTNVLFQRLPLIFCKEAALHMLKRLLERPFIWKTQGDLLFFRTVVLGIKTSPWTWFKGLEVWSLSPFQSLPTTSHPSGF